MLTIFTYIHYLFMFNKTNCNFSVIGELILHITYVTIQKKFYIPIDRNILPKH